MKRLTVVFMVIVFWLTGCNRVDELKKVTHTVCSGCGKVFGADTTVLKGTWYKNYQRGGGKFRVEGSYTYKDWEIIKLEKGEKVYNDTIWTDCSVCQKEWEEYCQKSKAEWEKEHMAMLSKEAKSKKWREYYQEEERKAKIRRRKKRERIATEKKQELANLFVESGIRFATISDVYRQMNYDLKYRTLSSQIQSKADEIARYTENTFLPAADEFGYYLNKYIEKYGIYEARNLAIKNGFLHVLN